MKSDNPASEHMLGPQYHCQLLVANGLVNGGALNGAVIAHATQTSTNRRYSDISNGPIAFTVRSYVMAATSATR